MLQFRKLFFIQDPYNISFLTSYTYKYYWQCTIGSLRSKVYSFYLICACHGGVQGMHGYTKLNVTKRCNISVEKNLASVWRGWKCGFLTTRRNSTTALRKWSGNVLISKAHRMTSSAWKILVCLQRIQKEKGESCINRSFAVDIICQNTIALVWSKQVW
jgi:hypothetical protein